MSDQSDRTLSKVTCKGPLLGLAGLQGPRVVDKHLSLSLINTLSLSVAAATATRSTAHRFKGPIYSASELLPLGMKPRTLSAGVCVGPPSQQTPLPHSSPRDEWLQATWLLPSSGGPWFLAHLISLLGSALNLERLKVTHFPVTYNTYRRQLSPP